MGMKFLLAFISRDRQRENLVEKLCARFNTAEEVKSWRYLAFCLSLLFSGSKSEKLLRKVCDEELVKKYEDKLADEEVFSYFVEIQNKCKKHVTPQFKETFEGWCALLNECHEKGKDDQEADERGASKMSKVKKSGKGKGKGNANAKGKKRKREAVAQSVRRGVGEE